jgi:chromosome segregation ATPase
MELTKETRDRIFAAADELFEQNGRDGFPTVDAVRKAARVNMNDASSGMKEWRRVQTAPVAPVVVQVPEAVQAAGGQAVAVLWQQAQELANESLRAAQAGWESERGELDAMRAELANAYESQAVELDAAQARIVELEKALAKADDQAKQEADRLRQERDQAVGRAKAAEEERDTAREEALRALAEITKIKAKTEAEHEAHQEQRKAAAQEAARQVERYIKAQAERDSSRKEASQAREEAATLRGRLEALETVMARATKAEGV